MNTGLKIGYILLGSGIGGFVTTLYFERELNKPIAPIEEYIPKSEVDKQNTDSDISNKSELNKNSLENKAQKRREEFEHLRDRNGNQTTRYSKMYNSLDNEIKDTNKQEFINPGYIQTGSIRYNPNDIPNDDEPYKEDVSKIDNELVRERVENNIEIYLGENPQDFVSLIFYSGDNTLTDDREHIVPNAEDVVGLVALSRLIEGGPGADNGVIFVRNLKTMINYEIILDAGSYSETVLGIFDSRLNKGAGGDVNS